MIFITKILFSQAIDRGVPMLLIPLFGDQHRNAMRASRAGYGKMIDFNDISTDLLVKTVHEMTTNNSYANRMKEISSISKDNLVDPMDEALFWIEYVIRHRGAKHLKSNAIHMSWFSYLLLDVLLVNVVALSLGTFLLVWIIRKCVCRDKNVTIANKKQA